MTSINASKLKLGLLLVGLKQSRFFNSSLDGFPPVEFLIYFFGDQVWLLCFDDLYEPANSIVVKIGTEFEFLGHRKLGGTSKIQLVDRNL